MCRAACKSKRKSNKTIEDEQVTLQDLLAKPSDEISAFLSGIYEQAAWVSERFVQRGEGFRNSIKTISDLAAAMKDIVDRLSNEKKLELLRGYPDLTEKAAKLRELTKDSQEEQCKAGMHTLTDSEIERFTSLNTSYREKFGFPFILAVRNATKYTVISALAGRVSKTPEEEFACALQNVHKIAWIRLLAKTNTDNSAGYLTCHVLDTANGCPGT